MDMKYLLARKGGAESRFDEQNKMKDEAAAECYRLQGEHRLLTELIELVKAQEPGKDEEDGTEVNS